MKEIIIKLYGCKAVYGPYDSKDGRRRCVLYFAKGHTTSKQYSRLLMEAKLGRLLTDDEEVDHIDTDSSNDAEDNLQVLPKVEHQKKSGKENSVRCNKQVDWNCPQCTKSFKVSRYRFKHTDNPCCSRSCASKYAGANQYGKYKEV